jgi:hypothetical protein
MRWFRDHIRQGSWAALFALAINLALSFGHVHAIDGNGQKNHSGGLVSALLSHNADHGQGEPGSDSLPDLCPICVAIAAIATGLGPTSPPVVPVDFAAATIDYTAEHAVSIGGSRWAAFQSRGPPLS